MSLCIPPLTTVPYQPLDPSQYLAHLLNTDGIDIMLVLEGSTDEEAIVDALAKIEGNRTGLETLYVQEESMEQGVRFIQNVAKVISKSELSVLDVHLTSEEGRAQILDSIQWEHIRRLTISTDEKSVGIRAMKALVEGRNKCNGPVVLDYFKFSCYCSETALDELPVLLRSFLASTSIETLWLLVQMTPPDLGSVLKTADLSRLDYINLKVDDYSSDEVDGIFECRGLVLRLHDESE
ncbi:hypothetical protein B0O80DRAFT_442746 [Mortierella sp. GBAus27b]|nr:hypothetical protein B0O80DRAFT_442746 [Mortierella sp. GBAus27b]